jgi:hypothetical protein
MKKVKIGLGRFYNAKFCELSGCESIIWEQQLHDVEVISRLGRNTNNILWGQFTFYKEPGQNQPEVYPGPDKFPAELYFEVTAYRWIEIDDCFADRLFENDADARDEVYKHEAFKNEMQQALNYTAGMLGLQVNPELVRIPIFDLDLKYIFKGNDTYSVQTGFGLEVPQTINIKNSKPGKIKLEISSLKIEEDKASECLAWLLRGWTADDYVLKFISFFTALEPVIPTAQKSDTEKFKSIKISLQKFVEQKYENEDKENLFSFLKNLSMPVSIVKRFEQWAREIKLENWENDITDFRRLNKIRNWLLHRGDSSIANEPHATNEDLQRLEFISKKYVGWALYGKRNTKPLNKIGKTIISATANFNIPVI